MENEALLRLIVTGILIAAGILFYQFFNRWTIRPSKSQNLLPDRLKPGTPAILYFTTPVCAPCITIQRPALKIVQEKIGEGVQIIEIDASSEPDLANAWNILSVPTTYIIDASGTPRHVNHGIARAEKLIQQIDEIR